LAVTDSIGKLSPQKSGRRFSGVARSGKSNFGPSNVRKYDGNKGSFGNRSSRPTEQPITRISKPALKAKETANIEDEDSEDEEDRRIAALEKKLGMHKEKRSKVEDDGLDGNLLPLIVLIIDLLEGIGTAKRGVKRKSDFGAKQTATKYRIAETESEEDTSDDSSEMEFEEESEFEGISASDSVDELLATPEAPEQLSTSRAIPTGKYIPPAARKAQQSALPARDEDLRLHKQIQGVLNR
jgi:hypothetical protein